MTTDAKKVQIKDVVKTYIEVDIQNEVENPTYKSKVLDIISIAEVEYFKGLRMLKTESKSNQESLLLLSSRAEDLYQDIVQSTNSNDVKDEDNKEVVVNTIAFQLQKAYLKERATFSDIYTMDNRYPTPEEMYFWHAEDVINWLPTHTITSYLYDRNLFEFSRKLTEVYEYREYTQKRGKPYFRLMNFLLNDPRRQEYGIRSVPGIDLSRVNSLLLKHLIPIGIARNEAEITGTAKVYYNKLRMWNGMATHNKIDESKFKEAYIHGIAVKNMEQINKDVSLAMREAVRTVSKAELQEKGLNPKAIDGLVADTCVLVKFKGFAVKEVAGLTFIFCKKLVVVSGEGEDVRIIVSTSYTDANKGVLKHVLKSNQKNR